MTSLRETPVAIDHRFDVTAIRSQFPILSGVIHGKPLVYLDNAATSQKPLAVIDAIDRYYRAENANIHRGVHALSELATRLYEDARESVRRFINARASQEIIFVKGTTDAINLVAQSYGRSRFGPGDEIVISAMEHHSNIVPWQMVCQQTGTVLRVIPMNDAGELLQEEYRRLLGPRVKLMAVTHVSNALGTINPVKSMIAEAHAAGIPVLVDGAQAVPHLRVDVQDLDADFYAFSGHKMYGPTGIGVLFGKHELLTAMDPYQGGGDMIRSVSFTRTIYNDLPYKFEAGTPHIAGGIALGTAIGLMEGLDRVAMEAQEHRLLRYTEERLAVIPGVRLIGTAAEKTGAVSFIMDDVHPHDIGTILDQEGIAIRTGHHCAQPVMERFGIPATARASFAVYNTTDDIDRLAEGLHQVRRVMGV